MLRNQRQEEFAKEWLKTKFGILYLCPRFGKIRTTTICLEKFNKPKVLVIYPIETIKKSWEEDLVKWGYDNNTLRYVTTTSLWKLAENPELFDVIVADEVHLFSPANLVELKKLIDFGNKKVLGLSGTISDKTRLEIFEAIGLPVVAHYPIEQGIREGVITDYQINVVITELDDKVRHMSLYKRSKKLVTEKWKYDWISKKILEKQIDSEEDLGLLPINRMHVLKSSLAKLNLTKKMIDRFKGERILIFCGVTAIADKLGVPVYHSKNKDEDVKNAFCEGKGDILATVDMFEAGVTIKPISKAIINSFDSNPENLSQRISRLTGYEYDNPDKKAVVYIVCTNTIEIKWLTKALEFFDPTKVKYLRA
jgi:superfamily II DNA or RNA helicase